MNNITWDTTTVLTAILAPLCLVFVGIIFKHWARIKELIYDKHAAVAQVAEITQRLADTRAQKDGDIERQKKEIEELHKKYGGGFGAWVA